MLSVSSVSITQSAARLAADPVAVSPNPGSATDFRGDWSWNHFYGHSSHSADSRMVVIGYSWSNVHKYLLTDYRTKACPRKMSSLNEMLDITWTMLTGP